MTTQLNYAGLLCLRSWGDADCILFLSSIEHPLAEELDEEIGGKNVNIRYWISNKECSKEQAQTDATYTLLGAAETNFGTNYSEYTGYLWTDEEVKIGGHDLIAELNSHIGKWLHLEIEIHEPNP